MRVWPLVVLVLASPALAGPDAWSVGDAVVVRVHGVGIVEAVVSDTDPAGDHWRVRIPSTGTVLHVPVDGAAELLHAMPDRPDAERLLASLRGPAEPDLRPWEIRYKVATSALLDGTLADQAEVLARQYARPYGMSFGQRKLVDTLETATLEPLAHVLGTDRDALASDLHRSSPAFAADAPPTPAGDPETERPSAAGLNDLGQFRAGGALVAGDPIYLHPDRDEASPEGRQANVVVNARPGAWNAWIDVHGGEAVALVVAHESVAPTRRNRRKARPVAEVWVDAGAVAIVDAARRSDHGLARELTLEFGGLGATAFGCVTWTDDGTYTVRVLEEPGRGAVLVEIEL